VTGWRPFTLVALACGLWSSWLCSLSAGWSDSMCSGKRSAFFEPSHSIGSSQTAWPGQSSYPNEAILSEKISILPDGVLSGFAPDRRGRPPA
jgi:hypothetical protein